MGLWWDGVNKRWCLGSRGDSKVVQQGASSDATKVFKSSVSFGSLAVGTLLRAIGTISLTGVQVGDIVTIQPRTAPTANVLSAWVATVNIIKFTLDNPLLDAAISTGAMTLDVKAERFS